MEHCKIGDQVIVTSDHQGIKTKMVMCITGKTAQFYKIGQDYYCKKRLILRGCNYIKTYISKYNQEEMDQYYLEQDIKKNRQKIRQIDIKLSEVMTDQEVLESHSLMDRLSKKYNKDDIEKE